MKSGDKIIVTSGDRKYRGRTGTILEGGFRNSLGEGYQVALNGKKSTTITIINECNLQKIG